MLTVFIVSNILFLGKLPGIEIFRMKKILWIILHIVTVTVYSQSLQKVLGKAYLAKTKDSSDYYFKKAKNSIKTEAEEAEYFFCKNARQLDFGSADSSLYYGKIAIEKLKKVNNKPSLFTVYDNIARLYKKQGQYDKAVTILFSGLKDAENAKEEGWQAFFNNNLSLTYHDFENYSKGVYYGKKALAYHAKKENPNKARIYSTINAIAINYDDWGKYKEALQYHYMVFKYMKGKDTLEISSTYNNIGNTLLKLKKYPEAQKWIQRAVNVTEACKKQKENYFEYDYEQATHYTNLATIATKLKDFEKAEKLFLIAKKHAKASDNAEKMRDYLQQYYLFNKERKNLEATVQAQEEYIQLRDSVFKKERANVVAEMETKYQTAKKEKELLLAKNNLLQKEAETKRKNLWLFIACLIAGFIALLGYLLVRQQKNRIAQQKQEFDLRTAIAKIASQNELQEQRLTISRDLHDNIGSQLTFIISSIENLKYSFGESNPKIDSKLAQISEFTKATIVELRDTIWAMNTNEIVFEDLKVRILNFLNNAKKAKEEVAFEVTIADSLQGVKLSSLVWINMYRTIQEAVNNAIKYANASKISVQVQEMGNAIQIQVKDNGLGFLVAETRKGNGLYNMEKRIQEIGGTFELQSELQQGTTIQITIKK